MVAARVRTVQSQVLLHLLVASGRTRRMHALVVPRACMGTHWRAWARMCCGTCSLAPAARVHKLVVPINQYKNQAIKQSTLSPKPTTYSLAPAARMHTLVVPRTTVPAATSAAAVVNWVARCGSAHGVVCGRACVCVCVRVCARVCACVCACVCCTRQGGLGHDTTAVHAHNSGSASG
jgi:hypothetical protein